MKSILITIVQKQTIHMPLAGDLLPASEGNDDDHKAWVLSGDDENFIPI